MPDKPKFNFAISLSVLDHLGRHLYRSFGTVLGEAISNAWDADAENVHIYVDQEKNKFVIKDDGVGMTADDFQNKLLKIGYSKRKKGGRKSDGGRPFIGRKGIGKLALLSCADRVTIIAKVKGGSYVGGVIDNSELDDAIKSDLEPDDYPLGQWDNADFKKYTKEHPHGTIIQFDGLKDGVKGSFEFLAKTIALYFRFSLVDDSFNIYLDDEKITHKHLKDLAEKTQFLWKIGNVDDPYVRELETLFAKDPDEHEIRKITLAGVTGFIASVEKPKDLNIRTTEDRVAIDLFVNGRLRERDILKHTPTARIAESYLYGQIHFNSLDDKVDRFTSSREGIVADDPKYKDFLDQFRAKIVKLTEEWDKLRVANRDPGDPENERLTPKERASHGLYGAVAKDYVSKETKKGKVTAWMDDLDADAAFNFVSYADCFVSENLIRKFIREQKVPLSEPAKTLIAEYKKREGESKGKGNISIEIRRVKNDLSYLDMAGLANLVDKKDPAKEACLSRDANEYKPMRDAVAHTALLSDLAKQRLSGVRDNIKGRLKNLLKGKS
jgi:hypothetical protein